MRRLFSSRTDTSVKVFNPITKLAHVKLDLPRILSDSMLPLLRQNIKARKAVYADVDRVHQLYHQHRHLQFEMN